MSPRSPYRQRDSFSVLNRPRSPAPTFIQTPRQEGDDSYPAAFLYKWIKSDRPRLSRPVSSYSSTKTEQVYHEAENNKPENKLPLEQALVHKEFHIEALRGQMRKLISENTAECSLLNDRINGLQAQLVSLRTRLGLSENNLKLADGTSAELEEELKELRRAFVEKSEALEGLEKEREEEVKNLHQALAQKSKALEFHERKREEEVDELQRRLAEKSEALESHEKARNEEVKELRRTLRKRSEDLESHRKEIEEEDRQLRQSFAIKSEALEDRNRELEEEITQLQRALAEKSEALKGCEREREEEVKGLQRALTETSNALQFHKRELEEKANELQNTLIETEAQEAHEQKLEGEVRELRQALVKKSKALEYQEQAKIKDLTAQKAELEQKFQKARKEDDRAATEQLEQREKTLIAHLNEKHSTELENLQKAFTADLRHVRDAHAAAVHELVARLEGKLSVLEQRREGSHFAGLLGGKLNRNRSKGSAKDKSENNIRTLCRDVFHVGRFRSRTDSCEQSRKADSRRDSGVHCSCACTNTVDSA